jgi:hypothetical protein
MEWLLCSPSSSEGRSGLHATALLASFVKVLCRGSGTLLEVGSCSACPRPPPSASKAATYHEGKAPVEDAGASGLRHDGKAPAELSSEARQAAEPHGFMAAVRHVMPTQAPPAADGDWQVVSHRRKWHQVACVPSPPPTHGPMPADLIGRCFNCLHEVHVAAVCMFPSCCLRSHHGGHEARSYKRPGLPDAAGPPLRLLQNSSSNPWPRLALVVVVNPRVGNIALAEPREWCHQLCSSTPPGQVRVSMLEGPPSWHSHPSPPLPSPLPQDPPPSQPPSLPGP